MKLFNIRLQKIESVEFSIDKPAKIKFLDNVGTKQSSLQ